MKCPKCGGERLIATLCRLATWEKNESTPWTYQGLLEGQKEFDIWCVFCDHSWKAKDLKGKHSFPGE